MNHTNPSTEIATKWSLRPQKTGKHKVAVVCWQRFFQVEDEGTNSLAKGMVSMGM